MKYFGTDGIRGQVNDDLSQATAYKCGNALGGKNKRCKKHRWIMGWQYNNYRSNEKIKWERKINNE